jgi:hypothetical protein
VTITPGELVGLPVGGPTSLALVKAHLQISDARSDTALTTIVAAVNNLVRSMTVSQVAVDAATWPDRIVYGATMLAGRLFRRKNSPAGVESFGQLGAAYVMRNDPDIAQLLELGNYQNPQVG